MDYRLVPLLKATYTVTLTTVIWDPDFIGVSGETVFHAELSANFYSF